MTAQRSPRVQVVIKAPGRNAPTVCIAQMVIPPEPTRKDRALKDEQQVLRVEILMMKGVRAKHQLMELLGIKNLRQVDRYVKRVLARWELEGIENDHRQFRGEGLRHLDFIGTEIWSSLANTEDEHIKQIAIKNLMRLQRLRNDMIGLNAASVANIDNPGADDDEIFKQKVARQTKLRQIIQKLLAMMQQAVLEETKITDKVQSN